MPWVSVIIPCYNLGEFLGEAIESVHAQTFTDYEIIIVDDGSDDPETLIKLTELKNLGLQIIKTENKGVAAARNHGIALAKGKYILPLDADDVIEPTYLEKVFAVFNERPGVSIVYCDQLMFGECDSQVSLPDYDSRRILVQNLLCVSGVFHKSDWVKVGGYCESMVFGWEDWEFWIAMSRLAPTVVKIAEPLFLYRIRTKSRDSSLNLPKKLAMFGLIAWRHKPVYFSNLGYILKVLPASIISGTYRRTKSYNQSSCGDL